MKEKSDKISDIISFFDGFGDCWEPMIDCLLNFWTNIFKKLYIRGI